ncbi:acyl-homoserine-lactone synthase [Vibrio sp. AND4]|uniref:acyl-homoserine-lactone synthase n=1 Tax=Vibrio sp. AND4 TaxID=314289 RepID=UPI00015F036C|nr:acyl-homoserine-lactone synthase [Vibrio sp. AND4]EDP58026.1 putative homoserine lactone synthase VanM [Vibrio sp. AND4]
MNFMSCFEVLSTDSMSIESKQVAIIDTILDDFNTQERKAIFQSVTDYRKKQLIALFPEHKAKSLSVLFELMDYRDLIQNYPSNFSPYIAALEIVVSQCFMHWLEFWCECEIRAIKQKSLINNQPISQLSLPLEDEAYYGILIDELEHSDMMVRTPSHANIMSISDAVTLTNLELFIKGKKWYEMLPLLSMSQTGKHFVLLKKVNSEEANVLVSSMLVQDWDNRDSWLSHAPQFSNSKWNYCLTNLECSNLEHLGVLESITSLNIQSIEEFDNTFKKALKDKHKVCEILRLAISGNTRQKLFFIYLTQKKLAQVLYTHGYKVSFTVIDQPFILDFYSNLKEGGYCSLGFCDLNNNKTLTYRGFWNITNLNAEFNKLSFYDYINLVNNKKEDKWVRRGTNV